MKRFAALLFAALLMLALASCDKEESGEEKLYDYDLSEYVTLGQYRGVTYTPLRTDPTDDEVWERIIETLDKCGLYAEEIFPDLKKTDITEGEVMFGDIADMSVSLAVDGEDKSGCATDSIETEIGSNFFTSNISESTAQEAGIDYGFLTQFMTDIELAAVGKQIGEAYTLTGTFPSDSFESELAGKSYVITAKVTRVNKRYGHPDTLTEDQLGVLGEYEDMQDYREAIIEKLTNSGAQTDEGEIWHRMTYDFWKAGWYDYTLNEYYFEDLTEGYVIYGDVVNISFTGYMDGETFEGGTSGEDGYDLEIGSNTFIEGFELGLVGVSVGETVSLELHFPDPYSANPDFSGKPVTFETTVNKILYRYGHPDVLPDVIMDELYEFGMPPSKGFDEFWDSIVSDLRAELEEDAQAAKENDVWDAVIANATLIKLPEKEYNEAYDQYVEYYSQYAAYYGVTLEEYVGIYGYTLEEFEQMGKEAASTQVFNTMVMYAVARAEGFDKLDESVYDEKAEPYVDYYGYTDVAEMRETLGAGVIKEMALSELVIELVVENAVAVQ